MLQFKARLRRLHYIMIDNTQANVTILSTNVPTEGAGIDERRNFMKVQKRSVKGYHGMTYG